MIKYDSRFNEAILALRKILIESNFDLLVRELKLPLTYFQVPGFVFYGHSIDKTLARIGKKYELLVRLFCLDQSVPAADVYHNVLPESVMADLIELGMFLKENDTLRTDHYCITPYLGCYFLATLGTVRSIGAYLGRQSYILATNLFADSFDSFLDLGSGCGILAILAARRARRAVGVDIMEEATEVAKTNAVLNGVADRVEFFLGDMYEPVGEGQFDSIVANAPFVALPEKYRDMVAISSGEDGLGFLRRLIGGMFKHKPKVARLLANGLGNESQPLLIDLLKSMNLSARGYRVKLLIYAKGLIEDSFTKGAVKIVEGTYKDRGEEISHDVVLAELKDLYRRLGVSYYYGIILEIEQKKSGVEIEFIDLSNKFNLQMATYFRDPVDVRSEVDLVLRLDTSSMPINQQEKAIFDALKNGGDLNNYPDLLGFYSGLEKVFGAEK